MQPIGELLGDWLNNRVVDEHRDARPGDYIAEDGLLHCGQCRKKREHRLRLNGRIVPCMCQCEWNLRIQEEIEKDLKDELDAVREMRNHSLIDARFYESTFDHFVADTPQNERVLRICKNYVEHFDELFAANQGLIFYGDPGTGKTFAASCIANALMARRVPVLVTSIVRLTTNIYGDGLNELLERMNAARLLVLDDFGAERGTDTRAEQVFTVIDSRYAAKKPMIITTNLTDFKNDADIRRRRVYDRIFEVCTPVKMTGASKRREEGQQKRAYVRGLLGI